MASRLATSTSPYLQQHAGNPVDWYEWGEEAFAAARERDVPILLSIGYAACHWCHVMAHESFDDAEVAAVVNERYVAIKVDREERPDVDAVYMDATVALTGQGGWPMTLLLTTTGHPFFAGTYLPREQFLRLLLGASAAWREDRTEVLSAGSRIASALAERADDGGSGMLSADELAAAVRNLDGAFDPTVGGFAGAPKFPPSMVVEFLLRHHERTGSKQPLTMAERTLDSMARGGIYDQLGGGFARYSVDSRWVVPHFEKMLYDNALLLSAYLHWWRLTGSPLAGRVAAETADFLLRELRTAEGGFASALDADTDGVEGLTYVWTRDQLADVLGEDSHAAAELFSVTEDGTFEHGASTLQLLVDPADPAFYDSARARLARSRARRPQPARDDKVVTAWNGLAVRALAEAGVLMGVPRYLDAAFACAELLWRVHRDGDRLRRTSRDGVAGAAAGVAEDYGDLAEGLLMLFQATLDDRWLTWAGELLDVALAHFADGNGGFYDTADDAEALVLRPREVSDNAAPSGPSSLASALVSYGSLVGSSRHLEAGRAAVGAVAGSAVTTPRFFGHLLGVGEALACGPLQVAISGERTGEPLSALAWARRTPGAVVVSGDADQTPLLAGRGLVGGAAAAYVCRGMVCDVPVTDVEALRAALSC